MKKIIALALAVLSVACLFAGCGASDEIVLPKQEVAETYENRVAALLETAWAYRRKNPYIQYDSCKLCVTGSKATGVRNADCAVSTPEMAGPQQTLFHVCSFFTSCCSYHTFNDYRELGGWAEHGNTRMATVVDEVKRFAVWNTALNALTEQEKLQKMEEFMSILQPGDMIYYTRNKTTVTHTVIWGGDLTGDGVDDIIHVGGDYYDTESKTEVREENGAVYINNDKLKIDSGVDYFTGPKNYDYFPSLKEISIIRYADEKHVEELPLTERAKTRLLFPGLVIWFEAEEGIYGAVPAGGEYTFTLRMQNVSQQDHTGLLVQIPTPENGEIVKVNGEEAKNKTIKLKTDIPADGEVTYTYTVKATGAVGDLLATGVGYVHAIPLPSLSATITSREVDADAVKAAIQAGSSKSGEEFLAAYLEAMGLDLTLGDADDVRSALYNRKNLGQNKIYMAKTAEEVKEEDQLLFKMQIPEYFGGQTVATAVDSLRVKEVRAQDLQAGDILIWRKDSSPDTLVAVHDGTDLIMAVGGGTMAVQQWQLDEFIMYDFFIALRPSRAI